MAEQYRRVIECDLTVSVPFFTGAIRLLTRQHGGKMWGENIEQFRAALALAEDAYLRLPDEPKKEKKRKQ